MLSNETTKSKPAGGTAPRDLVEIAEHLLAAGISFIPIRPDGSKAPDGKVLPFVPRGLNGKLEPSWNPYRENLPTLDEAHEWFADGRRGIAVVCGRVSGGVEDLDIDDLQLYEPWKSAVDQEMPGLVDRLTQHRTPGPGASVVYRCEEIAGSTKLAVGLRVDPKTGEQKPKTLIETRGEGGYFLIPGCPPTCHDTGRLYEHVAGPPLTEVPLITPLERQCLLRAAQSLNELADEVIDGPITANRNGAALRPGDDFNQRGPSWEEIIGPHGWVQVSSGRWRRPGKDRGWSATTGYCKNSDGHEQFAVFSSNASPFEGPRNGKPCTCYNKFATYTPLESWGRLLRSSA
jgi:hypothetical protein